MARKMTTVYKVVRRTQYWADEPNRLVSAIASVPLDWQVTYIPGKWVGPRHEGSLLFAFPTKSRAAQFRYGGSYEVWRADAEVVTKRMGFWQVTNGFAWMLAAFNDTKGLSRFWRRKTKSKYPSGTPYRTIGCRRIRLVKRVYATGAHY